MELYSMAKNWETAAQCRSYHGGDVSAERKIDGGQDENLVLGAYYLMDYKMGFSADKYLVSVCRDECVTRERRGSSAMMTTCDVMDLSRAVLYGVGVSVMSVSALSVSAI